MKQNADGFEPMTGKTHKEKKTSKSEWYDYNKNSQKEKKSKQWRQKWTGK